MIQNHDGEHRTHTLSHECQRQTDVIAKLLCFSVYFISINILDEIIFFISGPIVQLVTCVVSCRTAFKWCEFDPRDVQQLFGTPFSKVSLR